MFPTAINLNLPKFIVPWCIALYGLALAYPKKVSIETIKDMGIVISNASAEGLLQGIPSAAVEEKKVFGCCYGPCKER
jgi:hypothetical protein